MFRTRLSLERLENREAPSGIDPANPADTTGTSPTPTPVQTTPTDPAPPVSSPT